MRRSITGLVVWVSLARPAGAIGQPPPAPPPPNAPAAVEPSPPAPPPVDVPAPTYGPTLPENVGAFDVLFGDTPVGRFLADERVRTFGWVSAGYTASSGGSGQLAVQPRENRYGDDFLVNQIAIVTERTLDPSQLSFGYRATLWAGADPALIQPLGGVGSSSTNPRFGVDFRELYLSAHLTILTEGGVDLKIGRQNSVIGYESALAPYRPLYSNSYQWFYSEDGAFTGLVAAWNVTPRLTVVNGLTMGGNTFFTFRDGGPCYIGQVNYWLTDQKRTKLSAAVYTGPGSILASQPAGEGRNETMVELRVQHDWTPRVTQVVQSNMGWATGVPGFGTGAWYGVYTIGIFHLTPKLDLNTRAEWFNDADGTRTGFATNYSEVTLGLNCMPLPWLNFRPEIRGDFAGEAVFGSDPNTRTRNQLTVAGEVLVKF
ncbi:outer membrane beta-barrel protein [Fimbriiglobus ruber]|uniref:Porin n=1 Tax=Fimbriiglobus ruber TaxID=1908690 RepID=A0A225DFN2_9BACT|nr:outer membrane beta-barrel protein [Fimbriiglobus ruber]OWK40350.1 hypothetical protein FRUB_05269 [Fimbriiglobus ruber]